MKLFIAHLLFKLSRDTRFKTGEVDIKISQIISRRNMEPVRAGMELSPIGLPGMAVLGEASYIQP